MDEHVEENESNEQPSPIRMLALFILPEFLGSYDPLLKFAGKAHKRKLKRPNVSWA
jgi:hypothetical protein